MEEPPNDPGAPPPSWTPPRTLEEYELVRLIGRGAMGDVYLARDVLLDRSVAIKFVSSLDPDERSRKRFFTEARAIARLQHPNIVTIHRCGEVNGRPYLVSELIDGRSLDRLEKPLPWPKVREIAAALCAALEAAHRGGVLHRDIKPANTMIAADGRVKLVDFGVAALLDGVEDELPPSLPEIAAPALAARAAGEALVQTRSLGNELDARVEPTPPALSERRSEGKSEPRVRTTLRELAGTPLYMAPELWRGNPATRRSDVYSLGALLFELCTGAAPFAGVASSELPDRVLGSPAPKLAERAPADHRRFAELIDRCLQRDPGERPEISELLARVTAPLQKRTLKAAAVWVPIIAAVGTLAVMYAPERKAPVAVHSAKRLTYESGCEEFPAFSADGKTVYYSSTLERDEDIYALDLAGGQKRRLTEEPGWDLGVAVSPDGKWLAHMHVFEGLQELRVLPLAADAGGPAETLTTSLIGWPGWSPEGHLYVGTGTGAITRWAREDGKWSQRDVGRVTGNRSPRMMAPVEEGRVYFLYRIGGADELMNLAVLEPDGTITDLLAKASGVEGGLLVAPSGDALYYARQSSARANEVVRRTFDGDSFVVPGGVAPAAGFAISPDRKTLIYSTCRVFTTIARLAPGKAPDPFMRDSEWTDTYPRPLGGDKYLISSDRSGTRRLWIYDRAQQKSTPIGSAHGRHGAASADGRRLVYSDEEEGGVRLLDLETGAEKKLTDGKNDVWPKFSHDGTRVTFLRANGETANVWVVSIAGGQPKKIVDDAVYIYAVSPASDLLVYMVQRKVATFLATDLDGAPPREIAKKAAQRSAFEDLSISSDGKRLLAARNHAEAFEIDVEGDAEPRILWKTGPEAELHGVVYGDQPGELLGTIITWEGDLWMADGEFR